MVTFYLIGVLSTMYFIAGLFFLRYWADTRDSFFLAFAASFLMEGGARTALLFVDKPTEGNAAIYFVRLFATLLILGAILRKNYGAPR